MNPLNWGIIGPGNIAHDFARDLQRIHPSQRIAAVLGNRAEHVEAFNKEFNVPAGFTDLDLFIKNSRVDIVYISTPHPMHFKEALACLENNIHVLCEKPLTLNATQCEKLIAASEKYQCFLMEAMWIRFLPGIQKVLSIIKEGAIGNVISIKASMGYKAPKNESNRYFNPDLGGGSLLDLGIYPVFLAQLLLGKPSGVIAGGKLSDKGVDETCAILMHYEQGQHALLHSSIITQTDQPAIIEGDKGVIKILNPWFEKSPGIEWQVYDKEKQHFPVDWEGHGLQFETEEVLQCIDDGKIESSLFSHSFSLQLSETLDEIRKQLNVTYDKYE
ncbi:MAG: Gfo/Idh/MocA family oxidoreductase [Chitinophagaceae bacterium]